MDKDETKAMRCECGGTLVFRDEVFEAQLKEQLNGYIYIYECDKCKMLHFYKNSNLHRMHEPQVTNYYNTMNNDIIPDFYRIASEFYLSKPLPENYLAMDDDEFNKFLEENAWEPFQHWNSDDINECILGLSHRMHKIANEAANNANTPV